jgi:hypothetical protein
MKKLSKWFSLLMFFFLLSPMVQAEPDPAPSASPSFVAEEMAFYFSLGIGPQWLRTDLSEDISKNGMVMNGLLSAERKFEEFGSFGVGIGVQRVSQEGSNSDRSQSLIVNNPIFDIQWSHSFLLEQLDIGVSIRNFVGTGTYFNYQQTSDIQWLISAGPGVRYHFLVAQQAELVMSLSLLAGLNSPEHKIIQMPLQVAFRLPL